MQETQVQSLGWEDPLDEGMATHSSLLAQRIPWQRSLVGYSPWRPKVSVTTERFRHTLITIQRWSVIKPCPGALWAFDSKSLMASRPCLIMHRWEKTDNWKENFKGEDNFKLLEALGVSDSDTSLELPGGLQESGFSNAQGGRPQRVEWKWFQGGQGQANRHQAETKHARRARLGNPESEQRLMMWGNSYVRQQRSFIPLTC